MRWSHRLGPLIVAASTAANGCNGCGETSGVEDTDGIGPEETSQACEEQGAALPGLRRLTRLEFERSIRDIFPAIDGDWSGVSMGADPISEAGFSNDAATLLVGVQSADEINETAEDVATLATDNAHLSALLPCAEAGGAACMDTLISDYGGKLFRRPLSATETTRFVELFQSVESQSDFATAAKWTLVALINSPNFVYRSELGQVEGGARILEPWEVATALSYTFGGTTPSDELLAMAQAGDLGDPDIRAEIATQLVNTTAGREVAHEFLREWIQYGSVAGAVKNDVPEFESARVAMVDETRRFLDEVVFEAGGDITDILTSDYTVLDAELAEYYGYGSVDGPTLIARPPQWSVGLLAQGSILASRAHGESSSPTLRGKLVYERFFCGDLPPPPPDVPPIDPPEPGVMTTRERYEDAHAQDSCNACHTLMDPTGFAFEHFDNVGRYRADEGGLIIDATGTLVSPKEHETLEFDGLTELALAIAATPESSWCVAAYVETFYFGGLGEEACLAPVARDALAQSEMSLIEFIANLAATDTFVRRTGGE